MKMTELTEEDGKVIIENVSCEVTKFTHARKIEHLTDELTGEGILKVCQNLDLFDPAKSKLSTFTQTITQNMLTDKGRIATGRAKKQKTVQEQGWTSGCGNEPKRQRRMRSFVVVQQLHGLSREIGFLCLNEKCMSKNVSKFFPVWKKIMKRRAAKNRELIAWRTFHRREVEAFKAEFIRAWRNSLFEKMFLSESDL